MLTNSTIEILQKFDKKELLKFREFARSPYLNSVEILIKMYDEVAKYYPDFNSPKLSYENMWKKLYPAKPYNDKIIRNVYTKFSNLLKKFIGYEEFEAEEINVELKIIEGLNKRHSYKLSEKITENSKKKLLQEFKPSIDNYFQLFKLNEQYVEQMDYLRHETTKEFHNAIRDSSENFTSYVLSVMFQLLTQQSILKKNYRVESDETLLDRFIDSIDIGNVFKFLGNKNHKHFNHLKIKYLFYLYSSKDITLEEYYELKNIIFENAPEIEINEAITIFGVLGDILLTRIMPKQTGLTNEILLIGKKICEMNFYNEDSKLEFEVYTFRNFFTAAVMNKEFEWADNFVDKYIQYVRAEARENEYNYSKAIINFKLKKYEESLDFINKFQTTDILEKMNIRLYSLMNYIELGAHESAVSMISSIRQFTSESKEIPPAKEESLQNSLKFFSEIVKCLANGKKMDYAILKEAFALPKYFQKTYIYEKMETMV